MTARRLVAPGRRARRHGRKRRFSERFERRVFEMPGGRNHQIRREIRPIEISAQPIGVERRDRFRRAENGTSERMSRPELLSEHFVHEIIRRILDHLDLFEDDALLAVDVRWTERRPHDEVAQQIDRDRQMIVENLDVVAGVLLRRERVELPADGVDRLRNRLRRTRRRPLEQHVLDEMRDAALRVRSRAATRG